jgi:PAS domain S-box-containing protein
MKRDDVNKVSHLDNVVSQSPVEGTQHELMDLFNAMGEVFYTVDMINLRVMRISNACEKLFGFKQSHFLNDPKFWLRTIHPDDRHIIESEDKILRRGGLVNNQYRVICKDKSIKWVENKIIPCLDESGLLIRLDGITRDITERVETEEKHRQSEARYRQIVETAQEGIWTIDENEKTNFVNKKMADIMGYEPGEMLGKTPYDFMDDEGRIAAATRIKNRKKGEKESVDVRYITKSGKDVWTNISANPIVDKGGNYKGALAMITDITQRKIDEDTLKKSEANLRTIFDNTDTAYVLFNTEMTIISFNALAQKFSEEINRKSLEVNRLIKDYFTEERWLFVRETLDRVAAGEIVSYELSYTNEEGVVRWNNVRWLNVKDDQNKNWGFILANKDITEAKLAALEREKITADLIQHNKDLEQFTYIISHNLRAPVANIIGLSDMLKEHDLDAIAKDEVLERVSLSVKNVDAVIQDLNHILQARELANEKKEQVYFRELLDAIRTSIYNTVVSENVQFKCFFDEAESIFTVRSYLYSIFYNLSSNSIKYHKPGVAPVISIKSHKLKNKIELRFKDNGKGIDLEKYGSQIFGLYKRFDNTVEGKGMGLFMVKTQVEALGGTIRIKSKPGEGTEFVILLPV